MHMHTQTHSHSLSLWDCRQTARRNRWVRRL